MRSQCFSEYGFSRLTTGLSDSRKQGFTFPPPTGPRPIPHRKVTDDELLTLARSGLSIPEIAAKLGMGMANAHRRIKRLTERVELGPIGGVPRDKQ